ncbi:MAG: metalloregulator ArsR/SmtB family transcription factor [Dehalococcoidia bacterium]|nr:metalloregulator ArsR/SmtB family transcription factor [Dehalococcoidia bacterium]
MVLRTQQRQQETSPLDASLGTALAALANPVRLRIIQMLREREQCVCHLTDTLGLTQGTVSYHMGVLKQAGLILYRRDPSDARWVYYRLNPTGTAAFQTALSTLLNVTQADPTPARCCD